MLALVCSGALAQSSSSASESEAPYCNEAYYERELEALRLEIERLVGDPLAARIEWCRKVGIGGQSIVYSTWRSDEVRVEELAAIRRYVFAEYQDACGLHDPRTRTRGFPPPKRLDLVNGRCMLVSAGRSIRVN